MLSQKVRVKTLDNQMQYLEQLVKESYYLCSNLKQMLYHYFQTKDGAKYERIELIYAKAMNRYSRRWKSLTTKILTTTNYKNL